jgi:hypothetical protein
VPVERSQARIRALLQRHGATAFLAIEEWNANRIGFAFSYVKRWTTTENGVRKPHEQPFRVRTIVPVWTDATGPASHYPYVKQQQRYRQVWRALYWNLKARLEAVEFGLMTFEDAFMSDVVLEDSRTISEVFHEQLAHGRMALALPAPEVR